MADPAIAPAIDYDVAIVGGGLVGASLAVALERSGLRVTLLESHPFRQPGGPSFDDRTLALSSVSVDTLKALGLWPGMVDGVTPIERVHVSARGRLGTVRLDAADFGQESLGHVVEARLLGKALIERLPDLENLNILSPATLLSVDNRSDAVTIDIESDGDAQTLRVSALIGADGAGSTVRSSLGILAVMRDYEQTAIIANVVPGTAHANRAFERFTATGPVAMLPHVGSRCGSVQVLPTAQADAAMSLSDSQYLGLLQERFGWRLGRLSSLGKRASYPLRLSWCPEPVRGRCALIGNAAHSIHPVAAQGFNLGLRDVAAMASVLNGLTAENVADLLLEYHQGVQDDQQRIVALTDSLVDGFALDLPVLNHLPGTALMMIDRFPGLNRKLVSMMTGGRAA